MRKLRVLVLFGGSANDYTQSLLSAVSVLNALPEDQYECVPVGINRRGRWLYYPGDYDQIAASELQKLTPGFNETDFPKIQPWDENPDCMTAILSPDPVHHGILVLEDSGEYTRKRVDVVFSLLQGSIGEDGSVQGLCELSGIPFVGSGVLGSAVCRDKAFTHRILQAANIPTARYHAVPQRDLNRLEHELDQIEAKLRYPVYVKPSSNDSAVAAGKANDRAELLAMIKRAFTQDSTVLVEELCEGREYRVGVFGCERPFASFVGSLNKDGSVTVPAQLDDESVSIIRDMAVDAFCALSCKGLALFDFYQEESGNILLGEVNTIPELYETAPYPVLMADLGMRYPYLLAKLIEQAIEHSDRGI